MCGPSPTTNSRSWRRLAQGVTFALDLHATQTRKGTDTPYISHLLGVAGLVLEYGGSEDQAIAAMLHDAIEDQGAQHEPIIAERFGPVVARIVRGCTDTDRLPKPPGTSASRPISITSRMQTPTCCSCLRPTNYTTPARSVPT